MKDAKDTWTISQLAEELKIAPSQIRYYEQRELLNPRRSKGGQRIFSQQDRTRLKLILRGKRFGLSLDEMSAILGLSSDQRPEIDQLRDALSHAEKIKKDLLERKKEIAAIEKEVDINRERMRARLAILEEKGESDEG